MENLTKCYCGHTTTCDCGPETLEEVAGNFWLNDDSISYNDRISYVNGFEKGAKWQQERSYSEEEVKQMLLKSIGQRILLDDIGIPDWFEQFKKKIR
jgi:hypothetical protein